MGEVIPFPDRELVWLCACGNDKHYISVRLEAECTSCGSRVELMYFFNNEDE